MKMTSIFVHTQEVYLNLLRIYAKEKFVSLWLMESKCIWNTLLFHYTSQVLSSFFFSEVQHFVTPFQ